VNAAASLPGLFSRLIRKEVFENETALTAVEWAAAAYAGYFPIVCRVRFNAHEVVLRGAVRTLKARNGFHGASYIAPQTNLDRGLRQIM
jgi:hypothetical protein